MKYLLTLGALIACMFVYGQHMPDNKSFGIKASYNFSFPSFSATPNASLSSTTNPSFGAGFYFRYDFNDRFSFQPELLISSRSGTVNYATVAEPTTAITVTETSLSNLSQVTAELPLYFKMRWELTALHRGHYKPNKMIGVVVGPRVLFNMASSRETYSSEVTRLYNQESSLFVNGDKTSASDYYSTVTMGINVGVDFEVLDRLVLFANFYRGFISMNKSSQGFTSFDNRVEVGAGIKLY
ncbi:MAG: outer membrane beta-barrel protein [Crocinitomicaceae bacterium]